MSELHDRRVVFGGRPHQRRLSAPLLRRRSPWRRRSSSIFTASTLPVRAAVISGVSPSPKAALASAPALQQRFDHRGVADGGGLVQRRDAVAVGHLGVGAGGEQQPAPSRDRSSAPPSGAPSSLRRRRAFTSRRCFSSAPQRSCCRGRPRRRPRVAAGGGDAPAAITTPRKASRCLAACDQLRATGRPNADGTDVTCGALRVLGGESLTARSAPELSPNFSVSTPGLVHERRSSGSTAACSSPS